MYLYILNGKDEGKRIDLSPGSYLIGRSPEADIVLEDDNYVSGIHAELKITENQKLTMTDKGSKNGTFLLGESIKSIVEVKYGNIFRIGRTFFKFTRRSQERFFSESSISESCTEAIVVVDIVGSSKIA